MGGACVDKTRCLRELYRFAGRIVRETEHDQVSRFKTLASRFGSFALLDIDA